MKLFLDFFPLAIFFVVYKLSGLMAATAAIMVASLLSLMITYIKEKKISPSPLITGVIVTVFGGLTLYLHDDTFIKMKPTIINLLFAAILTGGLLMKKPLVKSLLSSALPLSDRGWYLLTFRWAVFFVFLAMLNEVVWRNFSESFWVNFKVFGMFPLTLLFLLCQIPLIQKHHLDPDSIR